ncbi:MAG: CDP-glucose 4,6-dehydratase, partial [Tepidisphaeraceae bacterium]
MNPSWWKSRKVFVTGHTGFKGTWLCLLLNRLGAEIHGYSLPAPTQPNLYDLAGVHEWAPGTVADIRDLPRLSAAIGEANAEIVIHMAAQPLVREGYQDPVETYATNVMGTVHLLEAVRHDGRGVSAVVVVTSDKCYENRERHEGYREDEAMGGYDPYSSSKGCAELVTSAYRRSYFHGTHPAVASARAGNVIGGGDWAKDRLIPDMIRAFAQNKPAIIRNPDSIRPWQHVLDPLAGYLTLAEHLAEKGQDFAQGWNFGPRDEDSQPVGWIAGRVVELWGGNARWERSAERHLHEASSLKLDAAKARTQLGWKPRTDLPAALAWTVSWYKAWNDRRDMRKFSLDQVEEFL